MKRSVTRGRLLQARLPPALLLRCGCEVRVPKDLPKDSSPLCPRHGPQGVERTLRVPPPRIRGVASGPHVTTEDLPAFVGRLTGSAPKEKP